MKKATLLIIITITVQTASYSQKKQTQDSGYVKIISGHITGRPYLKSSNATINVIIDSIAKYKNYKVKYNLTKPFTKTYSGHLTLAAPIDTILCKQSRLHKDFNYAIEKHTIIITNYN